MNTVNWFAKRNGLGAERVRQLCKAGKVSGAVKIGDGRGGIWMIPDNAEIIRLKHGRPKMVDAAKYPQLSLITWDRTNKKLTEQDAFMLYERNSKWVYPNSMDADERHLFDRLVLDYGQGIFNG